jgi:hypothetical protein
VVQIKAPLALLPPGSIIPNPTSVLDLLQTLEVQVVSLQDKALSMYRDAIEARPFLSNDPGESRDVVNAAVHQFNERCVCVERAIREKVSRTEAKAVGALKRFADAQKQCTELSRLFPALFPSSDTIVFASSSVIGLPECVRNISCTERSDLRRIMPKRASWP